MLGPCSVVVVLCVIGAITQAGAQEWIRHPISCDFESGQCGWSDDRNTTRHWSRSSTLGGDHYMALDMDGAHVNDSGLLSSPSLHGSLNQTCRLSFKRHIKSNSHACQLTVFMVTETNQTLLWRTSDITWGVLGISWKSERSPGLQWSCETQNFQIVFEGRKMKSGSCGGTVDVDEIEFYTKQQQTSTATPTTTTPTTAMTSQITVSAMMESTDTLHPHSENSTASEESTSTTLSTGNAEEFKGTGLSSGAVAAVVVVVIAVVVIVSLILVLLFLRRRAREQGKEDHWIFNLCRKRSKTPLPRSSAAFTNSAYVLNNQSQDGDGGSSTHHMGGQAASVHVYSTADDTGYELSSQTPHTYTNTTEQDDYNVLSRKDPPGPPSGTTPEDLYNHLNGHTDERFQHSKATPDQDVNSYSLAEPSDASSTVNTTATPRTATDYEVVNGDGNKTASSPLASPDTYNTLGETVGSRNDKPQNHYDHFHDTDGQYSTTDMQERTRDQQRKLAADLYSHAQ